MFKILRTFSIMNNYYNLETSLVQTSDLRVKKMSVLQK